jgi:hypothetical protein
VGLYRYKQKGKKQSQVFYCLLGKLGVETFAEKRTDAANLGRGFFFSFCYFFFPNQFDTNFINLIVYSKKKQLTCGRSGTDLTKKKKKKRLACRGTLGSFNFLKKRYCIWGIFKVFWPVMKNAPF